MTSVKFDMSLTLAKFDVSPSHRHQRPALRNMGDGSAEVAAVPEQLRALVQSDPSEILAADVGHRRVVPIEAVAGRVDTLLCCKTPPHSGRGSADTMELAHWEQRRSLVLNHTQIRRHEVARVDFGSEVMLSGCLVQTLQAVPHMPGVVLDYGRVS